MVAIAYTGRDLNRAERKYSATEREALAVIDRIERFPPYFRAKKFVIHRDHNALELLLEFLSKHANSVNKAFASLSRLTEMQDVLHQFSMVETKTLFGFPHLPPFIYFQITSCLAIELSMKFTSPALREGSPLFQPHG